MKGQLWVVAAGIGGGEASFAASVVRAAQRAGLRVRAFVAPESGRLIVGETAELLPRPEVFRTVVERERPAAVVFSSSGTCGAWIEATPSGPLLASLEFTWLMWANRAPRTITRLTRCYVLLPPVVWRAGLTREGGPFELSPPAVERALPVGWHEPAPQPPASREVLLYLGQRVPGEEFAYAEALMAAIEVVAAEAPGLRWRYVGTSAVPPSSWVERVPWLDPGEFRQRVAGASLVVCHHGMATISTAAAAGTPVLALTNGRSWRAGALPDWSDQEVATLERAGIVRAAFGRAPTAALVRRIRAALAAPRAPRAEAPGAEHVVRDLAAMLP